MSSPNKKNHCILTVVTASHLHWAMVLSESVLATNPDSDMLVFVLDASQAAVDGMAGNFFSSAVKLFGGDVLRDDLFTKARRYFNGFELCCAAKAFALEVALFKLGYAKAVFLDSDIRCYASFNDIWQALEEKSVALTPHVTAPFPEDGGDPDEVDMVRHGFVNGGFWAARADSAAQAALLWMKKRVAHLGFFAPGIGISADQTWMGCLPWLFPESVIILRHPGLNVAYWNLHERQLAVENSKFTSNGQNLVFFHYSGFDPGVPNALTKYHVRKPSEENQAILLPMLQEYAGKLQNAKARVPSIIADLPCSHKSLWQRFREYRNVYGVSHRFGERALLGALAERIAHQWKKWNAGLAGLCKKTSL